MKDYQDKSTSSQVYLDYIYLDFAVLPNAFLNGPTPAPFYLFSFSSSNVLQKKTVAFSGIRIRIVGVEGKHTDRQTTTTTTLLPNAFQFVFPKSCWHSNDVSLKRRVIQTTSPVHLLVLINLFCQFVSDHQKLSNSFEFLSRTSIRFWESAHVLELFLILGRSL